MFDFHKKIFEQLMEFGVEEDKNTILVPCGKEYHKIKFIGSTLTPPEKIPSYEDCRKFCENNPEFIKYPDATVLSFLRLEISEDEREKTLELVDEVRDMGYTVNVSDLERGRVFPKEDYKEEHEKLEKEIVNHNEKCMDIYNELLKMNKEFITNNLDTEFLKFENKGKDDLDIGGLRPNFRIVQDERDETRMDLVRDFNITVDIVCGNSELYNMAKEHNLIKQVHDIEKAGEELKRSTK